MDKACTGEREPLFKNLVSAYKIRGDALAAIAVFWMLLSCSRRSLRANDRAHHSYNKDKEKRAEQRATRNHRLIIALPLPAHG